MVDQQGRRQLDRDRCRRQCDFNYDVKVTPDGSPTAVRCWWHDHDQQPERVGRYHVDLADLLTRVVPARSPSGSVCCAEERLTERGLHLHHRRHDHQEHRNADLGQGRPTSPRMVQFRYCGCDLRSRRQINKTITVVDDKTDPLNPVTLGTANWSDGPQTFKYSFDKQGVAGKCTDYTNTAVIDETKQSDIQKVTSVSVKT